MADGKRDPTSETAELKKRQLEQERLEREQLITSGGDADADRHRRRADKARYLRQKLEQRERSETAEQSEGSEKERSEAPEQQ